MTFFAIARHLALWLLALLLLLFTDSSQAEAAATAYPQQPIRIIVYTSPGGLIDLTARRFAEIARRYTDGQPVVVLNRPGGGGVVAFEELLQQPADGYTLLAVTRSNISKFVSIGREDLLQQLDWHSYLMANPHVLITNKHSGLINWQALQDDAKAKQGRQLWLGADIGGVKHVSGLKMAAGAELNMRWIPYSSGGQAVAALIGGLGAAYLGNPRDVLASDNLSIVAVAAAQRLAAFPDAPTFNELGITGLEQELIWRGLALAQGVDPAVRQQLTALVERVTTDPDWLDFWVSDGVELKYRDSQYFQPLVARDIQEFQHYLGELGLVAETKTTTSGTLATSLLLSLLLMNGLLALLLMRSSLRQHAGQLLLPGAFVSLALLCLWLSLYLPPPSLADSIGASGIPRLWSGLLLLLALLQLLMLKGTLQRLTPDQSPSASPALLYRVFALLAAYVLLLPLLGYWLASMLFLPALLWLLHYRQLRTMLVLTSSWLAFSYLLFQRLLLVDLPTGFW
ncbi:Bug family tripartite tricarboxylate transporter substrate binding protein [Arsukibacterium sp.]|uniref:Bug family tripartite tricarboxylate transporter substrate binding protein n=1 Tax=Arsukibacterium sp. TaxID=1977258 RepID=UPI002FD97ECB